MIQTEWFQMAMGRQIHSEIPRAQTDAGKLIPDARGAQIRVEGPSAQTACQASDSQRKTTLILSAL